MITNISETKYGYKDGSTTIMQQRAIQVRAKYRLEKSDVTGPSGQKLYQLVATRPIGADIKVGTRGGYVERNPKPEALDPSQPKEKRVTVYTSPNIDIYEMGDAWIDENSIVCENAFVTGNARVANSIVCGNAVINSTDSHEISGIRVNGNTNIFNSDVFASNMNNVAITGNTEISNSAINFGEARCMIKDARINKSTINPCTSLRFDSVYMSGTKLAEQMPESKLNFAEASVIDSNLSGMINLVNSTVENVNSVYAHEKVSITGCNFRNVDDTCEISEPANYSNVILSAEDGKLKTTHIINGADDSKRYKLIISDSKDSDDGDVITSNFAKDIQRDALDALRKGKYITIIDMRNGTGFEGGPEEFLDTMTQQDQKVKYADQIRSNTETDAFNQSWDKFIGTKIESINITEADVPKQLMKYQLIPEGEYFRIVALKNFGRVKEGEKGGLVNGENVLSQKGSCWISEKSSVFAHNPDNRDEPVVQDNAQILGKSDIFGSVIITDNVRIDSSKVTGNDKGCRLHNDAIIYHSTIIDSDVMDNATVRKTGSGISVIEDSTVQGDAVIEDSYVTGCVVAENSEIHNSQVQNKYVLGYAIIDNSLRGDKDDTTTKILGWDPEGRHSDSGVGNLFKRPDVRVIDSLKLESTLIAVNDKYGVMEISDTLKETGSKIYMIMAMRNINTQKGLVRKGALGGFIEYKKDSDTKNLSTEGECWVFPKSYVIDGSSIRDNAVVAGGAVIKGSVVVMGNSIVEGDGTYVTSKQWKDQDTAKTVTNAIRDSKITGGAYIESSGILNSEVSGKVYVLNSTLSGSEVNVSRGSKNVIKNSMLDYTTVENIAQIYGSTLGGCTVRGPVYNKKLWDETIVPLKDRGFGDDDEFLTTAEKAKQAKEAEATTENKEGEV